MSPKQRIMCYSNGSQKIHSLLSHMVYAVPSCWNQTVANQWQNSESIEIRILLTCACSSDVTSSCNALLSSNKYNNDTKQYLKLLLFHYKMVTYGVHKNRFHSNIACFVCSQSQTNQKKAYLSLASDEYYLDAW